MRRGNQYLVLKRESAPSFVLFGEQCTTSHTCEVCRVAFYLSAINLEKLVDVHVGQCVDRVAQNIRYVRPTDCFVANMYAVCGVVTGDVAE